MKSVTALIGLLICFSNVSFAGTDKMPVMIDVNQFDIDEIHPGVVKDSEAKQAINFRFVRASGIEAIIFRLTYVDKKSHKLGTDDSFRVWASNAIKNGLHIGVYHFFRPGGPDIATQIAYFKNALHNACLDNAETLRGVPILIGFDAEKTDGESDLNNIHDIADFARAIKSSLGSYPVFYPENDLSDTFSINGIPKDDVSDLTACGLWSSRYSHKGPITGANGSVFGIWPQWTFWQYCEPDKWWEDQGNPGQKLDPVTHRWVDTKIPWDPLTQSPAAFAKGKTDATNRFFPFVYDRAQFQIGCPGCAIPVDCNFLNDAETISDVWNAHSWVALPRLP